MTEHESHRVYARVKSELLVWARKRSALDLDAAARKADVLPEVLQEWEQGVSKPTIPQLRKLADAYKRPLAVFYLSTPPVSFDPMKDFRRLPEHVGEPSFSPELHLEFRRAQNRRENALELLRELREDAVPFTARINLRMKPEDAATVARRELNFAPLRERAASENAILNHWIAQFEGKGVLVFHSKDVAIDEMRAFSISATQFPVIVLNGKDKPYGRVFSLFHELGHLLLNKGGVCDMRESSEIGSEDDQVEVFCNAFAGEMLVPAQVLNAHALVRHAPDNSRWQEDDLRDLSREFGVSREVVLRRLLSIGKTSRSFYNEKRVEYQQQYRRQREKVQNGGPSYHLLQLRNLGASFTRLVLDAYGREVITGSDVSDYLETKLNHLPKMEQELTARELQYAW